MCGIAGLIDSSSLRSGEKLRESAARMGEAIRSRGDDDRGVWVDAASGIALAHQRLSILDLSPAGHQPMHSASGRYVISFNGEIYNYEALRAELGVTWRGHSDTEVLLAAFDAWGIPETLARANGMFAIALWDNETRTITLARDRMGEKPLYYGWVGEQFVFASELKAFHSLAGWPPAIDRDALALFLRLAYVPEPYCIYQGIEKLMPGSYLQLRAGERTATTHRYFSLPELAQTATAQRFSGSVAQATNALEALLRSTVQARMASDVPLGSFLSGGIDSSLVTALMQAQSPAPINSFTIGFAEAGFNEAPHARAVANHLGTYHHELYVSARDAAAIIPELPRIYDEPFADGSQIPTFILAQFAKQTVTVALSGDGGDELFGGYTRHRLAPRLWAWLDCLSPAARHGLKTLLLRAGSALPIHSPRVAHFLNFCETLEAESFAAFYRALCSSTHTPNALLMEGSEPAWQPQARSDAMSDAEWLMLEDALGYFPGDIMVKVDRAAMAVGLETRTPFTDPELMKFAWALPHTMKISGGQGKFLLRQVLYRHVPQALVERPKAGFNVPIAAWLRGDLRDWAEALLAPALLHQQGYLDASAVRQLWAQHQSGSRDHAKILWNILMFQSWLTAQKIA